MKAVILAGGKGARLRPLTVSIPKPLVPIADKPILEIILDQLKWYNFDDITICVGYLADFIKSYFNEGRKHGVKISYSHETAPLGTAGALSILDKKDFKDTFLVINGDTLTTLNFKDFLEEHKKHKSIISMFIKKYKEKSRLGVIKVNSNNMIVNYIEKPEDEVLVSTGIYLMEPEVFDFIKPNTALSMPELINILIKEKKNVYGYITDDYWADIGIPEDYEKANTEFETIKCKLKQA